MRTINVIAGVLIASSGAGAAWAQDEDGSDGSEEPAGETAPEVAPQRHVLPEKRGVIQAFVGVNLSKDLVGKPISVAPDIWYGVTDELTVGLVHSTRAISGVIGIPGDGLCLTGEENGCAEVYQQVGVDVRYHLKDQGAITLAAEGGLFALAFDPFQVALKLGAQARWSSGKMAADLAPSFLLGLTEREPDGGGGTTEVETNKEIFFLPGTFYYEVVPKLAAAVQAALILPSEEAADTWLLAASLGGQYMVSEAIWAELQFSLPALAGGPEDGTGADLRTLTIGGGYAF